MRFGPSFIGRAVFFLYLPTMLMTLGQGMIIPALPEMAHFFGVSSAFAVQAITAQLIGRAIALIPAGAVIDRWGTKVLMVGGALLATCSGVAAAIAPNFFVVFASQFFWGMGMSAWMFAREFAAFDMVRADQRGRQMSALMGIGSTGMALGPAIGGFLTDAVGIRGLFVAYALASGAVLAISVGQKRVSVQRRRQEGGLFSLRRVWEIHPYFRLTFLILFLATFGQMARTQVTNSMLPLYSQEQLGYSPTASGLLFTVIGVVTFVMILPTGFISDKLGRKWAAAPSAVLSAVAFAAMPFAGDLQLLLLVVALIGIANGLAMGAMTIYTFDIVPQQARGQLQAMRRTFGEFGAVVSPPIAAVIATATSPAMTFLAFVPLHVVSAVLLIFFARESLQKRRQPEGFG